MLIRKWLRASALGALLLASGPALAQNCAGFTDVASSSTFCPNVEWLKNRQVTLGCTSATLYCPSDFVTRIAMAAFLNRVGTALTPVDLAPVAQTSVGRLDLSPPLGQVVCQSPTYTVQNYPRRASFNNKANLYNPSANVDIVTEVVYSTNNGVTWTPLPESPTYQVLKAGETPTADITTYQLGHLALDVGVTYKFGIRVRRFAGTGDVEVWCVNRVRIENRNGTSSPFDTAWDAPPSEMQFREGP